MTPEEAADHVEIAQVLALYFRAMDEKDYALLDRVFTPDATLHYDMSGGAKTTYRDMVPQFEDFNRWFLFTQHHAGIPTIDVSGDEARSSHTLRAVHVQRTRKGEHHRWTVYGFYRDRHVRTPGGWRIADRYFAGVHFEGELLSRDELECFEHPPWRARNPG